MASRAEILASNRGREPKSPAIYRRGRVNNSAAYYRAAKPQMDKAGRQSKALADFIGAVAKPIGEAVKAEQEEFIEAEKNAGIASFTRATPEQRAKMRYAIKHGIISESESPYFREGVSIAYTQNLLSKYNQDLFQQYEAWEKKNDPNSGTFDEFLDNFDAGYAPHFETIHEEVLANHFVPGQMGIRRQLQQRHTEHLNKNYREDAEAQLQGIMFTAVNDRANEATVEAVTGGLKYGEAVKQGKKNNAVELDHLISMRQGVEDKLTADEFDKKEQKKKPVGNLFKNVIAPGEIQGGDPKDKIVKIQKGKGYRHVIKSSNPTMFAKMSEKEKKEAVEWLENYNKKFNKDLKTGDPVKWNWQQFIRWQRHSKKNK